MFFWSLTKIFDIMVNSSKTYFNIKLNQLKFVFFIFKLQIK